MISKPMKETNMQVEIKEKKLLTSSQFQIHPLRFHLHDPAAAVASHSPFRPRAPLRAALSRPRHVLLETAFGNVDNGPAATPSSGARPRQLQVLN